jgi:hypothetical protein
MTLASYLFGIYVLIGIALLLVGPIGMLVTKEVEDARESAHAAAGRARVSESKLLMFRLILSLAVVLFWPPLIVMAFADRHGGLLRIGRLDQFRTPNTRLRFQGMGGAGSISCLECGFTKEIVSLLHDTDIFIAGYQCQSCGEFLQLENSRLDQVEGACQCGGIVAQNRVLFCPQCRSNRLIYDMTFIT